MKIKQFITSFTLFFLSAFSFTCLAQGSWTQKADYPLIARYHANGFSIGNKGYVAFGAGDFVPNTLSLVEYDPLTNIWTQKPDFPGGSRIKTQVFVINNIAYFVSGAFWNLSTGIYIGYNDVWKYDPSTNSYTQLNNFPGTPRHGGFAFSFDGKGYFGLGVDDDDQVLYDFWQYNPATDTWIQKTNFPGVPCRNGFQFSIDKNGYIGLGFTTGMSQLNTVWQYDASQDSWTQKNNFPSVGLSWLSCFTMNGKGYVVTGKKLSLNVLSTEFWEYTYQTDSWTSMPAFTGVARVAASGFSVAGKAYTGLGYSSTYLDDFWEFTPSTVGVNQTNEKQLAEVEIYPNPSNSEVNISIKNPDHKEISLEIFDTEGKYITQFKPGNNSQIITAEHSLFSAGVYYVAISIDKKTFVKKLVIQ